MCASADDGGREIGLRLRFFASTPRGFEDLLEAELSVFGAVGCKRRPGGVAFGGTLETAYRACLWSRLTEHLLLDVGSFSASSPEALYRGASGILWREHLDPAKRFAVTFVGRRSPLRHSHYAALKIKDAVVDQFRATTGSRPSVDVAHPDLRIHAFAEHDRITLSVDLAGEPLHRRGYRVRSVEAPIKETLAAGILLRAGWPDIAAAGGALVDPMCGSGTFLIEAAGIALISAPGLLRRRFGFDGWRQHDANLWQRLRNETERRQVGSEASCAPILGFDADPKAVSAAQANIDAAGLTHRVRVETRLISKLGEADVPADGGGLVVTNPPYGARLKQDDALEGLYRELGITLKSRFPGWRSVVLAGEDAPVNAIGLRAERSHRVFNGSLRCRLLRYRLHDGRTRERRSQSDGSSAVPSGDATDFANRLRKNLRRLGRWARRSGIDCFRVYDADLPEYALAIDLYRGDQLWAQVQEYAAPPSVDSRRADERLRAALAVIPKVLEIPQKNVVLKRRQRQRGKSQYERMQVTEEFIQVTEAGCRLLINLKDRLDTGLYLDHRPIRALVRKLAAGKRFLNLFAYTGAASVQAAAGGAVGSLSVDMSVTYSEWGLRNLELNAFAPPAHRYLRADCVEWLKTATESDFDLALLDPPTFSNSKRMRETLDAQRDHVELIRRTMRLLKPDGILLFSTHAKRFRIDAESLAEFSLEDLSEQTIPLDFQRSRRIHACWRITRR